ncbi:protein of unknown function [Nitrospira japonica]|uniref:Uncharacterized protein n=1 Tax=Nitrospira japonica TaxID=1325564 RepID=A0A1W1I375_9BACT|nr:protein of unknown function [Nitrospira japonica]
MRTHLSRQAAASGVEGDRRRIRIRRKTEPEDPAGAIPTRQTKEFWPISGWLVVGPSHVTLNASCGCFPRNAPVLHNNPRYPLTCRVTWLRSVDTLQAAEAAHSSSVEHQLTTKFRIVVLVSPPVEYACGRISSTETQYVIMEHLPKWCEDP